MKAQVYEKAHSLADFAIKLVEIPVPTPRDNDVLVDVRAIGVNPGEAAIRSMPSAEPGGCILLGWEIAGDRSSAIVLEAAQISNRANFPLKSKAKNSTARCSGFDRQQKEIAAKSQTVTMLGSNRGHCGAAEDSRGH